MREYRSRILVYGREIVGTSGLSNAWFKWNVRSYIAMDQQDNLSLCETGCGSKSKRRGKRQDSEENGRRKEREREGRRRRKNVNGKKRDRKSLEWMRHGNDRALWNPFSRSFLVRASSGPGSSVQTVGSTRIPGARSQATIPVSTYNSLLNSLSFFIHLSLSLSLAL